MVSAGVDGESFLLVNGELYTDDERERVL